MTRFGKITFALAITAAPFVIAVGQAAGETAIVGPDLSSFGGDLQAAAATACTNGVPYYGNILKKIPRYKIGFLSAWTEYNTGTCAANGPGSWTLGGQQKCAGDNCAKITFGVLKGLPLGNGACPGQKYNFAAICYEWNIHDDAKVTDKVDATWKPPTISPQTFSFPIKVPIVYPDKEKTAVKMWDPDGYVRYEQTISNKDDSKFDWSLNKVREQDAGGKKTNDTCWCAGSKYPQFYRITGGEWNVDDKGVWGEDYVGWGSTYVDYYRKKRRAPCGTSFPQQMQFQATNLNTKWVNYRVNILGSTFTYKDLTSVRDGVTFTHSLNPVATKTQRTCDKITWPTSPALAQAKSGDRITVNDPRPVAAAIEEIERVSGTVITYEDAPALHKSNMTPMVMGADDDVVQVPKGGTLSFQLPSKGENPAEAVRAMVSAYNARLGAATFSVLHDGLIQVVPQQTRDKSGRLVVTKPVLDSKIALEAKPRTAMATLEAICEAVSAATGQKIEPGIVPFNAMRQKKVSIGADNETARSVLKKLIAATGMKMSWALFYDPGTKDYALNMPVID